MSDSPAEIFESLRDYLADAFSVAASDIRWDSSLQDLGLDSVDVLQVAAALMDMAGGDGPWEESTPVTTVADLVSLVAETRS
jgi:acyl carrier protein